MLPVLLSRLCLGFGLVVLITTSTLSGRATCTVGVCFLPGFLGVRLRAPNGLLESRARRRGRGAGLAGLFPLSLLDDGVGAPEDVDADLDLRSEL